MLSGAASSKKILATFFLGTCFGFMFTYYAVQLWRPDATSEPRHIDHSPRAEFLPRFPHSHGEMDQFRGPEEQQTWNDFEENHHGESSVVADALFSEVRVLCWVMTNPNNYVSKAQHVKATWGKRCNKLLFMSSKSDAKLPAIGLNVREGRDYLWGKTRQAFQYIYAHHYDDVDWVMKADDDTYVVVENLRHMLKDYDPHEPLYFGRRFKPYVPQGYMSGGAGYVLSKEAVRKFVKEGLPNGAKCRQDPGGAEDLEMGQCMQNIGVHAADSRDKYGRETFHPFVPQHHIIPGMIPRDNWYWEYNYYRAKEGPECCSDFAITFHYVPPNMMYVFEYMVYHLRPYGISTQLAVPLDESAASKYLAAGQQPASPPASGATPAHAAAHKDEPPPSPHSGKPQGALGATDELSNNSVKERLQNEIVVEGAEPRNFRKKDVKHETFDNKGINEISDFNA